MDIAEATDEGDEIAGRRNNELAQASELVVHVLGQNRLPGRARLKIVHEIMRVMLGT
jgi:hypothetical protein